MKYFTKNVFAFLFAMTLVGLTNSLMAQTPFWTEDFGSEADFNAEWVNGGTNPGSEVWSWSDNPGPVFNGQPAFGAPTAANGFVEFNSDANGEGNAHDVTLTTVNPIDCSAASEVFIRFISQYAHFYGPTAQVGVSTDGVVFTYYTVLEEEEQQDFSNPAISTIVELPQAAGQAQVWIQFRWQGEWEYIWRIDDIDLFASSPLPAVQYEIGD